MNIIIGAGAAGLGAYYGNPNAEIFEKQGEIGGLCGGFSINGFWFDNAVHLSFTENKLVRSIFDKTDFFTYTPNPYSWFNELWLKHPAQNNLYPLEPIKKAKIIESFVNRPAMSEPETFEDWAISQYGEYLYEKMFKPYNEKYWCYPLNKLAIDWIGNRFATPSLYDILLGTYTENVPNAYYAKEMRYPQKGGYRAFFSSIEDELQRNKKIHFGKELILIDSMNKKVVFSDGQIVSYEKAYISMPLPNIIKCIKNVPDRIRGLADSLKHTSIMAVSFGFRQTIDIKKLWFYIYDKDIYAARAYLSSNKSINNSPDKKTSIQFEIYFNSDDTEPSKSACIDNCKYALKKMKIADPSLIEVEDARVLPYANIIFEKETINTKMEIIHWLEQNNIYPIGRFGKWEYLWSDQAFLSGYNASMN